MIVVECAFNDHPSRLELRPRHRELLAELKEQGVLVDAGPFPDGTGSICVFSADQKRVDEALAADPYFSCEGVRVVAVRQVDALFGT